MPKRNTSNAMVLRTLESLAAKPGKHKRYWKRKLAKLQAQLVVK